MESNFLSILPFMASEIAAMLAASSVTGVLMVLVGVLRFDKNWEEELDLNRKLNVPGQMVTSSFCLVSGQQNTN